MEIVNDNTEIRRKVRDEHLLRWMIIDKQGATSGHVELNKMIYREKPRYIRRNQKLMMKAVLPIVMVHLMSQLSWATVPRFWVFILFCFMWCFVLFWLR